MIDDDAIREIVCRLARPIADGAHTIERAAILAEGSHCAEIEAWIVRRGGEPHTGGTATVGRGLHAERARTDRSPSSSAPSRYVLPVNSLV